MTISEIIAKPDGYFKEAEVCAALDKSVAWAQRHRWAGTGIPYVKLGRSVRYRGADIASWITAHRVETTQAPAA